MVMGTLSKRPDHGEDYQHTCQSHRSSGSNHRRKTLAERALSVERKGELHRVELDKRATGRRKKEAEAQGPGTPN
jgi:hypothetical protein